MKLMRPISRTKAPRFIRNIRIPEVRPSRLFADDDRDGVANVFDCQPRNRRRQDDRYGYGTDMADMTMVLDEPKNLSEEGLKKRRQWQRRGLIDKD